MTPQELIQNYNLSLSTVFVPFSQSRNKDSDWQSLNWKVTLLKGKQEVITADYSCGIAHCPAKNKQWQSALAKRNAIASEIETGFPSKAGWNDKVFPVKGPKIEPQINDVIFSLVMDSDVLNYCGFEDWCDNFGYSSDSIQAKGIYDCCLGTALKLRGYLGQSFFDDAAAAFEDY